MSTLLLDVGNSRLKWALAENGHIGPVHAVEHGGDPAAALPLAVIAAAARAGDGAIEAAWAANVTGPLHAEALSASLQALSAAPLQFAAVRRVCAGMRVAYVDPARLGIDRWLCMLALWDELRSGFVVASAGTALTCDVVDDDGSHLGGIIAPGLMTAQRAVLGATRFPADAPAHAYGAGLGSDTDTCVRQGALHACAGAVERLAQRYAAPAPRRVLTGGDAAILLPHLDGDWQSRGDLVFAGLLRYALHPPATHREGPQPPLHTSGL